MAKKDGPNKPEVPAAKAVGIESNNDLVEEQEENHGWQWYAETYASVSAVGFNSEWRRGELLRDAKAELPERPYKRFIDVVLGQSVRHAQRWVKVVNTFSKSIEKSLTTLENLSDVGMTKLFVIANTLAPENWGFNSGRTQVRKDEDSQWVYVDALTVAALEAYSEVSKRDPLLAMKTAVGKFQELPVAPDSPAWNEALKTLHAEHHTAIEKRIGALTTAINKSNAALAQLTDERDGLDFIQHFFESCNSNAHAQLEEVKVENARLQEQLQRLLADQQSDQVQEVDSNVDDLAPLMFE
jgi:hypothetical protein